MLAVPRSQQFEAAGRICFPPGFEENFCHLCVCCGIIWDFIAQWL